MAQIIIPARKKTVISGRNKKVEVHEGDLVMLFIENRRSGSAPRVNLGVFIKEYKTRGRYRSEEHKMVRYMDVDLAFNLGPCETFGGVQILPIESVRGRYEYRLGGRGHVQDMYVEPEQIAAKLRRMKGFGQHAEWIARLQRPYL